MTRQEKEEHVQAIVERLNGMRFADANEILDTAKDRALGALKIILPVHEDEQAPVRKRPDTEQQECAAFHEVLDELLGKP